LGSSGPLSEVLLARSSEIAEAVSETVGREVALSSGWLLTTHEREGLTRARSVERVLKLIVSGEPLSDNDLAYHRNLGRIFAVHRIPLPILVAVFENGITAITRKSWQIAAPEHFAEMTRFTERMAELAEQARKVFIDSYLEVCAENGGQPNRWVMADALAAGEPDVAAAWAVGERLASGYLVLACAVAAPAALSAEQADAIYQRIEAIPGALHCGDLSALVILLPAEDAQRLPEAAAVGLASGLRELAGGPVHVAQAYQPGLAAIPAALDEACRTLSLVQAIPDADSHPYQADMLLVELAIARQPDIRQRLAALLTPLDAGSDLHRTLEALLACDLDRERTASKLCIHRRTLRYRMDRIRDLTGIDPDTAHGIQLLRAALFAARLPLT
jgi:PucR C-terminal helix-turn-helix domain